ncbi:MAG: trigger factor [Fimbriiglobus sp.]
MADETQALVNGVMEAAGAVPKLNQKVDISDAGPCRKHVKVTIARNDIDGMIDDQYKKLMIDSPAAIPGFRIGKAPRKIIERKYKNEVLADVKTQLLMMSLEQLADEANLSPLSPPELNPNAVNIPDTGDMVYEFKIEVRPEFELASYKELKIKKPVHTFTDAEVAAEAKRLLEPFGPIAPKSGDNPVIAMNDIVTFEGTVMHDGKELNTFKDVQLTVEKKLALSDGVAEDFGDKVVGAKVGEKRVVEITLSQEIGNESLRGAIVQAHFNVLDIKIRREPEKNEALFENFGVRTEAQFEEFVRTRLGRVMEQTQRNVARSEIFEALAKNANFDLPKDLLDRQSRKALQRRLMEMQSAGMNMNQIQGRIRYLQQDIVRSTANSLKEHFVLQKIAELEKLEIEDEEIEDEIDNIATQTGESPRKVRARLERDDMMEAIATELLERKALDKVLETATFEEYEFNPLKNAADEEISVADAKASPNE